MDRRAGELRAADGALVAGRDVVPTRTSAQGIDADAADSRTNDHTVEAGLQVTRRY
ncbi:hypothetical protein [Streptomyces sp. NK08204]|uniref:hypothetical protein n=1 Tax=Streptomyces sp. NK08204 TaxID=2873260 RepID=UPI001CEDC7D9|nr:hypothetical protein [Streptomyces sp. NK08204]